MARFDIFRRLLRGEAERRQESRVQASVGARVLVVDDSATIRAVLAKMLIQDGYTVLKAADGESALELARQEQPDLIFLDIVLPQMNGFAVLRALRRDERTRGIPIVMISGNLQATEQFYVQRFGADDFMKKPFGRAEVFERIRQLVESGRLPAREQGTSSTTHLHVVASENMDHVPDIALPDEDLHEEQLAAAPEPTASPLPQAHVAEPHHAVVRQDSTAPVATPEAYRALPPDTLPNGSGPTTELLEPVVSKPAVDEQPVQNMLFPDSDSEQPPDSPTSYAD